MRRTFQSLLLARLLGQGRGVTRFTWVCLFLAGWFVAQGMGNGQELTPPTFIQEPVNRTAVSGSTITLSGNVVGSLPIYYQWRFNELELPGATNRSYVLRDVRLQDAGHYRLGASNVAGFVLSSNATLTVTQQPPTISGQPASKRGAVGSQLSISVAAVGSLPLSYQWRFNDREIAGATSNILTLHITSRAQEGEYRVEIRNVVGSVLSAPALLTVVDLEQALDSVDMAWDSSGTPGWTPEITIQHDGSDAAYSGAVGYLSQSKLSTEVVGPGRLTFWWLNAAVTPEPVLWMQSDGVIQVSAAPVLGWQSVTVYLTEGFHTLEWVCAGLRSGITASGWLDDVRFQPGATSAQFVKPVLNLVVPAGSDPVFSAVAEGTPPLRYQWYFNDAPIPGATGPELSLSNVQAPAAGRYDVTVSNDFGTGISSGELVVTESAPTLVTLPGTQRVLLRRDATFTVEGRGTEPLEYQWTRNGVPISGATNRTFVIRSVGSNDLGNYEVTIRNELGSVTGLAQVVQQFSQLVAWGANTQRQSTIPPDVVESWVFAGGPAYSAAIRPDGRVAFWGAAPGSIANRPLLAIAAGSRHATGLAPDGHLFSLAGTVANPPGSLENVVAIGAGADVGLALHRNGRVSVWGSGAASLAIVPRELTNVLAIACGRHHALALKADSRVVAWGTDYFGDTQVPSGVEGIVSIACGVFHSLALRSDGTVICWGDNQFGQCAPPPELTGVIAVAGGLEHSMALRDDGMVVVWGGNRTGQTNVPAMVSNVVAIASGELHCLAMLKDGSPFPMAPPLAPVRPQNVPTGALVSFGTPWAGTRPLSFQWQRDGVDISGATDESFVLEEATLADAGGYRCVARNEFGIWYGPFYQLSVERTLPRFGVSLFGLQFNAGGLGLEVNDLSGHGSMVLYASTNLLQWEPIYTNPTPVLGTVRVLDPEALKLPRRFYRASEQ